MYVNNFFYYPIRPTSDQQYNSLVQIGSNSLRTNLSKKISSHIFNLFVYQMVIPLAPGSHQVCCVYFYFYQNQKECKQVFQLIPRLFPGLQENIFLDKNQNSILEKKKPKNFTFKMLFFFFPKHNTYLNKKQNKKCDIVILRKEGQSVTNSSCCSMLHKSYLCIVS